MFSNHLGSVAPANAKGCLKAHYAVHHGAAAGCIIGEAKKRAQMEREKSERPAAHNSED
jgi:hypothetical protein